MTLGLEYSICWTATGMLRAVCTLHGLCSEIPERHVGRRGPVLSRIGHHTRNIRLDRDPRGFRRQILLERMEQPRGRRSSTGARSARLHPCGWPPRSG